MNPLLQDFLEPVLRHLMAPPQCEACGEEVPISSGLCEACRKKLPALRTSHCNLCALPFEGEELSEHRCQECLQRPPSYQKAIAAFEFEGSTATLLHSGKFGRNPRALKILAAEGREAFSAAWGEFSADYLVPVPLSWRRRWKRGFNQSYLLARYLREYSGIDIPIFDRIRRTHTEPQAKKTRAARLRALRGIFSVSNTPALKAAKLMLVDDVMTTGATVESLSRELMRGGAKAVRVFVLARVGRK